MSIRKNCPCDIDGICPYEATYNCDCEYWCGADEPEDERRYWNEIKESEKTE